MQLRRGPEPAPRRDDMTAPDFERLGGEAGVRAVVDAVLDRVFADAIIGFYFDRAPKARIRELEARFAMAHLGGPDTYDGRPLDVAHAPHRIFDGHFARRIAILRETLVEVAVPADVAARWVAHAEAQRAHIVVAACR
ncbi:MAG: group 1 truncated hemoglobin [Deltaproteobacteria bacterium]|nr:group 1 truncated hemoglobin [Deltaproteobacteria bacterium]